MSTPTEENRFPWNACAGYHWLGNDCLIRLLQAMCLYPQRFRLTDVLYLASELCLDLVNALFLVPSNRITNARVCNICIAKLLRHSYIWYLLVRTTRPQVAVREVDRRIYSHFFFQNICLGQKNVTSRCYHFLQQWDFTSCMQGSFRYHVYHMNVQSKDERWQSKNILAS